ncbi:hypothetical protein [Kingella oralis]|nr:hypothetical protein [Kingella oralis]
MFTGWAMGLRRCSLVFHVNKDNAAGGRLGLRWDALRLFSGCL